MNPHGDILCAMKPHLHHLLENLAGNVGSVEEDVKYS